MFKKMNIVYYYACYDVIEKSKGETNMIYVLCIVLLIILLAFILTLKRKTNIPEVKETENKGERLAKEIIKKGLDKTDTLISNVIIEHNDKKCECDDIVINKYGVFIVEVKYYLGKLSGRIEDRKWNERCYDENGNMINRRVKNPFVQVDRNVKIAANLLKDKGLKVNVKGFVMAPNNRQIVGKQLLKTSNDVYGRMHEEIGEHISRCKQRYILKLLR